MSLRLNMIWLLFALAVPQAGAPQQTPGARPSAAITGVVVDGVTGEAIAGAAVQLRSESRRLTNTAPREITDDNGRFAFLNLTAASDYIVTASKAGYFEGGYGRNTAPTDQLRPVGITGDEWVGNVRVSIWKPGSIAGVVMDEAGDAVVGVYVRAIARFRLLGHDEVAAGPLTVTDDRGAYRLPGLSPGKYIIQVPSVQASVPAGTAVRSTPNDENDGSVDVDDSSRLVIGRYPLPPPALNGRLLAYPAAFHPAATSLAQATAIDVSFGDERSNVNVTLAPVPVARVSGIVEAPLEALAGLTLRLLPAGLEQLGQGAEVATAFVAADGQFAFLNVPAGTYTIDAPLRISEFVAPMTGQRNLFPVPPGRGGWNRATEPIDAMPGLNFVSTDFRGGGGANYSGRSSVTVGAANTTGVVVRLTPNGVMAGRVVLEETAGQGRAPRPATIMLSLDPAGGEASLGMPRPRRPMSPDDDASFQIPNITPGRYWLRVIAQAEPPALSDSAAMAILKRLADRPGWLVKSIIWKGRDYVSEPFDAAGADDFSDVVVTLTNAVPELSGLVSAVEEIPRDRTIVIVFPANAALWRNNGLKPAGLKMATVSTTGSFRFTNLPAGDYFVAAIDRSRALSWQEPEFLTKVQRSATRVSLSWGANIIQALTPVVVR